MRHNRKGGINRYIKCTFQVLAALLLPTFVELFIAFFILFTGSDFLDNHFSLYLILDETALLTLGALWYYFGFYKKRGTERPGSFLSVRSIPALVLMAAALYVLTSVVLFCEEFLLPDAMAVYDSLMEKSGFESLTLISSVSTLVLAPIAEELVFRGVMSGYLKRAGVRFMTANLIQAAMFGIFHMNPIQGLYAFLLGLLLGYVREKYGTLLASMFLHAGYNFFGTYLAAALLVFPDTGYLYAVLLLIGLVILAASFWLMRRDLARAREKVA